jgi:hypothetical protein
MRGLEDVFKETVEWFGKDIAGFLKALLQPHSARQLPPVGRFELMVADMARSGLWSGPTYWITGKPGHCRCRCRSFMPRRIWVRHEDVQAGHANVRGMRYPGWLFRAV